MKSPAPCKSQMNINTRALYGDSGEPRDGTGPDPEYEVSLDLSVHPDNEIIY